MHVGRPLGRRVLEGPWAEQEAVAELARRRHACARAFLEDAAAPPLDEATLRLGVAVHNLLALGHPGLLGRRGAAHCRRIAGETEPIADVGPPPTAEEAVRRHSLLSRLGDIARTEHTVQTWVGRRRFVGRRPPARVLALPRLRRVSVSRVTRPWWAEIGVPACARGVWIAIHRASPLGEALDPGRLDPPVAWERIFPVLRHPALCRLVAGRLVDVGIEATGGALVAALFRFAAARDTRGSEASSVAAAFAVRFLAHAFWLHHLFGPGQDPDPGSDLAALIVAAEDVEPRLIWPSDVPMDGDLGRSFAARLARLRAAVRARPPERFAATLALCRFAAGGL